MFIVQRIMKGISHFFLKSAFLIGIISEAIGEDENMYRCPDHLSRTIYLKTFQEKCYRFEKTELYWTTAKRRCAGEGGNLIQIRNLETQNWVVSTLNELHWNTNGVWIGAHDRGDEWNWRWVTGEKITWSYWASGQPNCDWLCMEDCGTLRRDDGGRWHDKPCSFAGFYYSYICQYDMKPATTTTTTSTTTTTPTTTTSTTTTTTSTTTTPTTTTTTPTTTTIPSTTTPPTTISTTTTATTTTIPTTTTTHTISTTQRVIVTVNGSDTGVSYAQKQGLGSGETAGLIIACILGGLVLILLMGVCFFRSKNKKGQESFTMHFDNLTYTVRRVLSSQRMSTHEKNLNNQVSTGSLNEYADPECVATTCTPTNSCTAAKEPSHYTEIPDKAFLGKLNVCLPKYDNSEYEKCNIAKSKLGQSSPPQYLEAFYDSKHLYDSVRESAEVCNAMNEHLENSKNQYEECGNVDTLDKESTTGNVDSSPNHYMELDEEDVKNNASFDHASLQLDLGSSIYEEPANTIGQATSIDDVVGNFEGTLDLAKAPAGYNNNLYDSKAQ